jgi:hypothetical protein
MCMHYLLADLALDKSIDGARGALCCMLLPHREVGQGSGRPLLQPYVRRVAAHRRDQRLNPPLCVCVCVCVCVCDCKGTYIRV